MVSLALTGDTYQLVQQAHAATPRLAGVSQPSGYSPETGDGIHLRTPTRVRDLADSRGISPRPDLLPSPLFTEYLDVDYELEGYISTIALYRRRDHSDRPREPAGSETGSIVVPAL